VAVILRAEHVLPIVSPVIRDGGVVVENARIVDFGGFEEIRRRHDGEAVELGSQVLMPGLVNAHCHLDYTQLRHAISPQRSFTEWIRAINSHKRALHDEDYLGAIERGFSELRKWGTTTVANIESFPELMLRMPPPPLRTWWFMEMIDIRHRFSTEDAVAGALAFFEPERPGWLGGFGLSPHAPYTASGPLFELASRASTELGMPVTTHVAESREEWEMFKSATGELYDFMLKLGRWMYDCHHSHTPLGQLAHNVDLGSRWILAHMNELDDSDFALLDALPAKPSVVHCPGSHRYFRHAVFPLERLRATGVNLCLGTDSLASTDSLSMFDEMRGLATAHPALDAAEIVAIATVNGARALGFDGGKIAIGAAADLIAFPVADTSAGVHAAVLAHRAPVRWMMLNGQILPT
jgi:cytosine/adenosine deaminase-related metal-dependent hydrolase